MDNVIASAAQADRARKWLTCLGCGRTMWTDRCHRICKKCRRRNEAAPMKRAFALSLPREACYAESPARSTTFDY